MWTPSLQRDSTTHEDECMSVWKAPHTYIVFFIGKELLLRESVCGHPRGGSVGWRRPGHRLNIEFAASGLQKK